MNEGDSITPSDVQAEVGTPVPAETTIPNAPEGGAIDAATTIPNSPDGAAIPAQSTIPDASPAPGAAPGLENASNAAPPTPEAQPKALSSVDVLINTGLIQEEARANFEQKDKLALYQDIMDAHQIFAHEPDKQEQIRQHLIDLVIRDKAAPDLILNQQNANEPAVRKFLEEFVANADKLSDLLNAKAIENVTGKLSGMSQTELQDIEAAATPEEAEAILTKGDAEKANKLKQLKDFAMGLSAESLRVLAEGFQHSNANVLFDLILGRTHDGFGGLSSRFGSEWQEKKDEIITLQQFKTKLESPQKFALSFQEAFYNSEKGLHKWLDLSTEQQVLIKQAAEGETESLELLLEKFITKLFHGSEEERTKYWNNARAILGEKLFPDKHQALGQEVYQYLYRAYNGQEDLTKLIYPQGKKPSP